MQISLPIHIINHYLVVYITTNAFSYYVDKAKRIIDT